MNNIINIEDNKPHQTVQVLCLNTIRKDFETKDRNDNDIVTEIYGPCFYQYVSVCPVGTDLKKLQCPRCLGVDSFSVHIDAVYE